MNNQRHRLVLGSILALLPALTLVTPVAATPLARTHIVLPSTISVDPDAGIATLPLHRGTAAGKTVWYIVTDSSDQADAKRRDALFAPLLANAGAGCDACVRRATESNGAINFPGAPDFSASRKYVASATGFPPSAAAPGATAGEKYTPFLRIGDAVVNAPIVAVGDGDFDVVKHTNTQDRVVAIDTEKKTVTLALARGFSNGKRVVYISTEASDAGAAAIERATFVPLLKPTAGFVSIDVIANGANQGLGFVALRGNLSEDASAANAAQLGSSMNILTTFPTGATALAYSPLWNVQIIAWRSTAGAQRERVLKSNADVAAVTAQTTGPDGKPIGPVGFVVNCPVIAYVDSAP